jgi:hypothetical protein
MTEQLLAPLFDGAPLAGEPPPDELVRLAVILARLPGPGARAAEARLDALLDAACERVRSRT